MRISTIAKLAGHRGAISYLQKQGGMVADVLMSNPATAAGIGFNAYGAVNNGVNKYHKTVNDMNRASGETLKHGDWGSFLGGMSGLKPTSVNPNATISTPSLGQHGSSLGGQLALSSLSPILQAPAAGIAERIKGFFGPKEEKPGLMEQFQQGAISSLGKAVSTVGADLLKDLASKAMAAIGNIGNASAREAILKQLKHEDPILAEQSDKVLMEAYHTMVRFAPTLSTDKNAVRSFLRQAVMSGTGPDYASIKLLADTERAVTGGGKKD